MMENGPRFVRCPICAHEFHWPNDQMLSLFDDENESYELVDISNESESRQRDLERQGYRQCPNTSEDTTEHYIPASYWRYRDPLVIGLVGASASGKTHLLTAMIREAYRVGLPHGVTVAALDLRRHATFRRRFIEPFEKGDALSATDFGVVEAADILLLRGPGGERPVTFFDVAGEDLEKTSGRNRATRFLVGANAVIFVYAPEDQFETGKDTAASENQSFDLAVERLRARPGGIDGLPAVIAVTKSDRLRYVPPADRWLRRGDTRVLDAASIRAESRDVFSYLHHIGAGASLRPFQAFPRCTLHFVSASGRDAVRVDPNDKKSKGKFPRGIQPTRVLEPLVAILAMTGMVPSPEAQKVGMP
ncbi:MAG TPA: hypothetical protein VGX25_17330 [Actinophytocola sp.]|uniref:hypothetical protein n=1 Tax=Actinophytocola sp. TaxID=1872138 RepID=UPI002DDD0A50|nr:hypothetical protein [Actinophytocola sp.]HEV2781150.1 hypothetical protein [Actinophytocola sp.]